MTPNHAKLRAVLDDADVTLGDCIQAFAADENDPHLQVARAILHQEGVLEIGEPACVSHCPDSNGAYVMAWVWVEMPEAPDTGAMPLDFIHEQA